MNSFLYENGFDRIYSQYDYPKEKIVNNFGVQDDYLFSYGLERLNEAGEKDNPFFAVFLTVSNHKPYVIPEEFKNRADTDDKRITGFVDKAVKDFMESAAEPAWYNHTIFVFLGDHGKSFGAGKYDMQLTFNHIPLIIYSPSFDDAPRQFAQFGGQIDVFPTVMGLLNIPYINNSLGVDLLKDPKRPCMYFVNDNRLGCINENYLYVRNLTTKTDILYDLHSSGSENIIQQESKASDALKKYAVSMMVTADYLIKNNQTK
jgi:phosphoglycerol transferase MdoB-like AlkP superfamily enzyme